MVLITEATRTTNAVSFETNFFIRVSCSIKTKDSTELPAPLLLIRYDTGL